MGVRDVSTIPHPVQTGNINIMASIHMKGYSTIAAARAVSARAGAVSANFGGSLQPIKISADRPRQKRRMMEICSGSAVCSVTVVQCGSVSGRDGDVTYEPLITLGNTCQP